MDPALDVEEAGGGPVSVVLTPLFAVERDGREGMATAFRGLLAFGQMTSHQHPEGRSTSCCLWSAWQ